jgi:SAM-dependent methyltransferase
MIKGENDQIEKNRRAYSFPFSVDFYKKNRNKVEDVYESERIFLFPAIEKSGSVLDIGCAVGGFYEIMKTLKPDIHYTGIDISPEMIKVAKQTYPEALFEICDGCNLKYRENSFDLVFCTGVLVHNPDYQEMVREMYRVSSKYLIIDLPRLVARDYKYEESECYTILKNRFSSNSEDEAIEEDSRVPFFITNPQPIFNFLLTGLAPKPKTLLAKGYYGSVAHGAVIPFKKVCFCVVFIEKGAENLQTTIWVDLPEDIAALLEFPNENWVKDKTKDIADFIL